MSNDFAEPGLHSIIFAPSELNRIPDGCTVELLKVRAGHTVKALGDGPRILKDGRICIDFEVYDEIGDLFPNCTLEIGDPDA